MDNPLAHEKTTTPEILEQLDGKVDAIVLGVGSSGTVSGMCKYLNEHAPDVEVILAKLKPEGYRIRSMIREIALSPLFRRP